MTTHSNAESNVQSAIAAWLSVTKTLEPDSGLDPQKAHRRAGELLKLILRGKIRPADVELTEDFKDVLSALVGSLRDFEPLNQRCSTADAVYQFISRIPWPNREADEKRDLLYECAEIGWGAMGLTIAEVILLRSADDPVVAYGMTDPIRIPLAASCRALWEAVNRAPARVAEESIAMHKRLGSRDSFEGLFDDRQYFLGETALLAAAALRILGKREDTERWLAQARADYRETVSPAVRSTSIGYVRLALLYDAGRFEVVSELAPSLISSFEELGMRKQEAKTRLIKAAVLKTTGQTRQAVKELLLILENREVQGDAQLLARVLIEIGDSRQIEGDLGGALEALQQASQLLEGEAATGTLGDLRLDIGALLRSLGRFGKAAEALREALAIYSSLEMSTRAAYLRVLIAENLIAAGRPHEAEWELLAALPTIEEQKMVPEGFAAVALLKESVRRRKTDPNALRELREHLQKQK